MDAAAASRHIVKAHYSLTLIMLTTILFAALLSLAASTPAGGSNAAYCSTVSKLIGNQQSVATSFCTAYLATTTTVTTTALGTLIS